MYNLSCRVFFLKMSLMKKKKYSYLLFLFLPQSEREVRQVAGSAAQFASHRFVDVPQQLPSIKC